MPSKPDVVLTRPIREALELRVRSRSSRADDARKARLILMLADGETFDAISTRRQVGAATFVRGDHFDFPLRMGTKQFGECRYVRRVGPDHARPEFFRCPRRVLRRRTVSRQQTREHGRAYEEATEQSDACRG